MSTYQTVTELYNNTLKNCKFYERENMPLCLLNEIGVLRGAAYCLEMSGQCPHDETFLHFINIQNELTKEEREKGFKHD